MEILVTDRGATQTMPLLVPPWVGHNEQQGHRTEMDNSTFIVWSVEHWIVTLGEIEYRLFVWWKLDVTKWISH